MKHSPSREAMTFSHCGDLNLSLFPQVLTASAVSPLFVNATNPSLTHPHVFVMYAYTGTGTALLLLSKTVHIHSVKAYGGRSGAPLILGLGAKWWEVVSFIPRVSIK
jgi:hypothetical protein